MNANNNQYAPLRQTSIFRSHLLVISLFYIFVLMTMVFFFGKQYVDVLGFLWPFITLTLAISFLAIAFPKFSAWVIMSISITAEIMGIYLINKVGLVNYWDPNLGIYFINTSFVMMVGLSAYSTLFRPKKESGISLSKTNINPLENNSLKIVRRKRRRDYIRSRLSTSLKTPKFR